MLNLNDFLNVVKKASLEAVNADQPSDFLFGKVTSVKPLKILVEQKMTLGKAQLVLTRNVTDYEVKMTMDCETETTKLSATHAHEIEPENDSLEIKSKTIGLNHSHSIKGEKTFIIHNALQVDDEVILLKKKGGQKYLVLDRVVKA